MIVDLSHKLEPGMPTYPGVSKAVFRNTLEHHDLKEQRRRYASGTTFQLTAYELAGNTGTYLDAPFHRFSQGFDLSRLSLDKLVDLEGILVPTHIDGPIDVENLQDIPVGNRAVLLFSGWSCYWGTERYFTSGPYLTRAAAEFLVHAEARLVGIDSANVDDMSDKSRPAHTVLLQAAIPIVEHLRGLAELINLNFRFYAAPPAIVGGTSFPVRAFAIGQPQSHEGETVKTVGRTKC